MRFKILTQFLLYIFFCTVAFSQTDKGKLVISGKTDLNFLFTNTVLGTDSIETGKIKNNQFGFTAAAGYFILNNLNVGISGSYSYSYTKTNATQLLPGNTENITQSVTILPQVNYYFPVEGKLRPFVAMGAGYIWLEERDSRFTGNHNEVYSMNGTVFSAGAGLSYFINHAVSFDLGFQYSHSKLKEKRNKSQIQKQNSVAGTIGISVFF